jgi:RHS repeat-associated protein
MGYSTQKFFPEHQPKAALSPQLWHEKTASRKFFDRTKIASKKSPAKPTTTREKSDRTYETATEVINEHYRYTAFGEPEIYDSSGNKLATSAIKNEILWNSRRYDSTTNLYYYKYRHYNPSLGRWPSRDPIEEDGGVNLYGFVGNSTLCRIDVFGMWASGGTVNEYYEWEQQNADGRNLSVRAQTYFELKVKQNTDLSVTLLVNIPIFFIAENKPHNSVSGNSFGKRKQNQAEIDAKMVDYVAQFQTGVDNAWNDRFQLCCPKIEIAQSSGGTKDVTKDCGGCMDIRVEIDKKSSRPSAGGKVWIYDWGPDDQNRLWPPSNQISWNLSDRNGTPGQVAAHEIGHFLGNIDEYGTQLNPHLASGGPDTTYGQGSHPDQGNDGSSVMADIKGKGQARHMWRVLKAYNGNTPDNQCFIKLKK